jgi:hypothetical protein
LPQILFLLHQYFAHHNTSGTRMVLQGKFPTDHSQILCTYVRNVVTKAVWCLGFVHLWAKNRYNQKHASW